MRRTTFYAAVAGAALTLAACSGGTEEAPPAEDVAADAATDAAAAAPAASAVLDANNATVEELAAAPGMTPEIAAAVVAGRPYANVTAFNTKLMETLTAEQAEAVRAGVFVPINLNTASEEEIRLIPGMTDKMVHEFEEYRPYADMGVFDREIGKYVDAAEVARLRSYVTL